MDVVIITPSSNVTIALYIFNARVCTSRNVRSRARDMSQGSNVYVWVYIYIERESTHRLVVQIGESHPLQSVGHQARELPLLPARDDGGDADFTPRTITADTGVGLQRRAATFSPCHLLCGFYFSLLYISSILQTYMYRFPTCCCNTRCTRVCLCI